MTGTSSPIVSPPSMEEINRTVAVPLSPVPWWRRLFAFVGPAYMVSVGYMDPGNWATDLAGGANFGYTLIWVLLLSNVVAILMQTLSARLGLVTGHDLAQACRDDYPPAVRNVLFILCEIAIAACDLAEALGSAIGLNLLFGIPVFWAILITGFDVLVLLLIQRAGIRKMEALIVLLVATIGACFVVEIFLCQPQWGGVLGGFVPNVPALLGGDDRSKMMLYVAMGIIGAIVMPHNLYLHSSLAQSRDVPRSVASVAQACKYNLIDSIVALNGAFLVNGAILVVAATAFATKGIEVTEIQQAHGMLESLLGSNIAPIVFAVALICAGQSSTVTGTLAGQITMEGFLRLRLRPWLRRLVTRVLAIGPALIVVGLASQGGGDGNHATFMLLVFSQVILSLQLPFAVVPLIRFTSSRRKMGPFANRWWVQVLAWVAAALIIGLNVKLVVDAVAGWVEVAGAWGPVVAVTTGPVFLALAGLLAWMTFRPEKGALKAERVNADSIASGAMAAQKKFACIGVALEAKETDSAMLAEAISLARTHQAHLVLMHVVEGVGGQWHGPQTGDQESREDELYLTRLAGQLSGQLEGQGVKVHSVLGYGDVPSQIVKIAQREGVDLLVVGGHGHGKFSEVIRGKTISSVRHGLKVPVFSVRG